jgi:hypothetical protein
MAKLSSNNGKRVGLNVSLPPVKTCAYHCKGCYAYSAYRRMPNVKAAWDANLAEYERSPKDYFASLLTQLKITKSLTFRWHVGGDCPTQSYFRGVCQTAQETSHLKHLMFTKRYSWAERNHSLIPANLSVVLSAWPGKRLYNPHKLPVAWMQDGTETRIPTNAMLCGGLCDSCGLCWELPSIGRDVYFMKHN